MSGDSYDAIRLSVAVMTHPSRRRLADRLAVTHPDLNITVVSDPEPDGPPGSFRTARAAWSSVAPDATHHLVLQDDVELCANFSTALRTAIASRRAAAVSLFAEWGSRTSHGLRIAAITGRAWAQVTDTYVPSQGLVLPAEVARAADRHLARAEAQAIPDDQALLRYLTDSHVPCYAFLPNLLEHSDVASLVGNTEMGRRPSVCFFAGGATPGELAHLADPEAAAVTDYVPYFSWTEATAYFGVRDAAAPERWRLVPAAEVFGRRGIDRRALAQAFDRAVRQPRTGPDLREDFGPILLHQLWLTAAAYGLRIADTTGDRTLPPMSSRIARRAVSTLAPGGLRRFLPARRLPGLHRELGPLLEAAMRYGATVPSATDSALTPHAMAVP